MSPKRVMILAGTQEARQLANALVDSGVDVLSSFAGVTRAPLLPRGQVRIGGFGGVEGLVDTLKAERITHVVDATHPYAAQMSAHAFGAARIAGLELVRLERKAWVRIAGADWIEVSDVSQAPMAVPNGARVLLTTGRKGLGGYFDRPDLTGIIRTIEPPDEVLPGQWSLVLDRPPHSHADEIALMQRESITCLVSKNAGGEATCAKIVAAAHLGIAVVMVSRPSKPIVTSFENVPSVLAHLNRGAA